MRLAEDVTERALRPGRDLVLGQRRRDATSAQALTNDRGALPRARRAAAGDRRGLDLRRGDRDASGARLLERFVDATQRRIEAEMAAEQRPQMPAAATAFALVWMAERTFYQQLVQGDPVGAERRSLDALVGIYLRTVYGRGGPLRPLARSLGLAPDRVELAGLHAPLDVGVDLGLGRLRAQPPQPHRVDAAELEDLEHVDEVDARGQHEQPERPHDDRPAERRAARCCRSRARSAARPRSRPSVSVQA